MNLLSSRRSEFMSVCNGHQTDYLSFDWRKQEQEGAKVGHAGGAGGGGGAGGVGGGKVTVKGFTSPCTLA